MTKTNQNEKVKQCLNFLNKIPISHLIKANIRNEMVQACLKIHTSEYKCIKLFSFLFVIVAYAITAYLVIGSFVTYFQYDVTTNKRTIYEIPAPFPKIKICTFTPFQTEYAVHFLKEINEEISPNVSVFDEKQMKNINYREKTQLIDRIFNIGITRMNTFLTHEQKRNLSHQFDDILVSCRFNLMKCSSYDFSWYFDSNYGNCYAFNSGFNMTGNRIPLKQSFISDSDYGLQIEMYAGFHRNLTLFTKTYGGFGLFIHILNETYLEFNFDGVKVATGFQTDINIGREFETYLGKPYSDCELANDEKKNFNSDLYNLIYHNSYQYNQHTCLIQCFQRLLITHCNCTNAFLLSLFDADICKTNGELECVQETLKNKFSSKYFIRNECLPLCPLECNTTMFNYDVSSIQICGNMYVDYVNERPNLQRDFLYENITYNDAKNSFAIFNVFYDELSYKESKNCHKWTLWLCLARLAAI